MPYVEMIEIGDTVEYLAEWKKPKDYWFLEVNL